MFLCIFMFMVFLSVVINVPCFWHTVKIAKYKLQQKLDINKVKMYEGWKKNFDTSTVIKILINLHISNTYSFICYDTTRLINYKLSHGMHTDTTSNVMFLPCFKFSNKCVSIIKFHKNAFLLHGTWVLCKQ